MKEKYRIKLKLKDDENLMEKNQTKNKKGKAKNNFAYNTKKRNKNTKLMEIPVGSCRSP
jgi:uncharacterized protein (DUF2344 family)